MALLLTPLSIPAADWLRCFAAELPGMEVRVWPDVGDRAEIDIAVVGRLPDGELASFPHLRLIASLFAGQDLLLSDPALPPGVPIVRTSNPDGEVMMSETALLHVLRHHRSLPAYLLAQQRREWKPLRRIPASQRRVGVMGLGALGLGVARMLRDHGFDVAGWVRRPRQAEGIAVFHGRDQLGAFLARSEILVNLLPLTTQTPDILCRETLAQLPQGASVINLARGQHLVEEDLLAALDSGQIAAATLDVFRTEPLPRESPLWTHPGVTITPHVARRLEAPGIVARVAENIRRLQRGQELRELIDRQAGY